MAPSEAPVAVEIRNVVKRFGSFTALRSATLTIRDNEFFTLLGPSGCGKTTLLRLIAGFENVTDGDVFLYGEDISDMPASKRPVNTVFQHYALFPHMTVKENVAFGLKMRGLPGAEIASRVSRMLDLVHLEQFADRKPNQLSGGQQQRAALARAIAPRPKVLLLDEPLSALDLKLRQAMRIELKQLQKETGITFVFVTHDQEEALAMSDRIAVMSQGTIQQTGTAKEIYDRPVNQFVANFIGETNLLEAEIHGAGSETAFRLANGARIACEAGKPPAGQSGKGMILIRPERILIKKAGGGMEATVTNAVYLGTDTHYSVRLEGGPELSVRVQNTEPDRSFFSVGDRVSVRIPDGAARLLAE